MASVDLHLFLHGGLILLVGLLGGIPFAKAIRTRSGREVAWRVVHSGCSMGGIMLIAMGAMIERLAMPALMNQILLWSLVVTGWGLAFAMVLAAATGERGIGKREPAGTPTWGVVRVLYHIGVVSSLVAALVFVAGCVLRLR